MTDLMITAELRQLADRATEAAEQAYVPYSKFRVGAALLTVDGSVFLGCNVENAAYSATICAERTACASAVAAGHRTFRAIAVHVDVEHGSPCGVCRQFLAEFGTDLIVVFRERGELVARPLSELLPSAFVATSLV